MIFELFPGPELTDADHEVVSQILDNPIFQKYLRFLAYRTLMDINLLQSENPENDQLYMRKLARAHGNLETLQTLFNRA